MTIGYTITLALAMGLLVGYLALVKKKNFWLGLLFVCVAVINLGYLMLSLAKTLPMAIIGNDVAYLGNIFLSVCMFLIIVQLCGYSVKRTHVTVCLTLAAVMFLLVATSGLLPWFYRELNLDTSVTPAKLVKVYGTLHFVYMVYLLGFFAAMVGIIIHSVAKKRVGSPKMAGLMAGVVCGNIIIWLFEKLIPFDFEILSVTYILSEIVLLMLFWMMQDYVHIDQAAQITVSAPQYKDLSQIPEEEKMARALALLSEGEMLASREREVLALVLKYQKRREIAEQLHLSENTVKTHTRNLYAKLGVANREELYARVLNS